MTAVARCFRRNYSSINYLLSSIPKPTEVPQPPKQRSIPKHVPPADLSKSIINPNTLNQKFRYDEYGTPTPALIQKAASFFYNASPKHEWTKADYLEIPDVKVERLMSERQSKMSELGPLDVSEYDVTRGNSKTSFGFSPDLLRPLPEVLLLGHTNAGKSTLVNSILLDKSQAKSKNKETEYAYVSSRAGFTKCLISFNVANKLRIIDSPGYGMYGKETQGDLVLDYIQNRKQLRRVFVLIDGTRGFADEDAQLIEYLVESGVPFEIIFTKVDQVIATQFPKINVTHSKADIEGRIADNEGVQVGNANVEAYFALLINETGLRHLATLPKLLFNNSRCNLFLNKRYGYNEIRYAILESCGLIESPPLPPPKPITAKESRGRKKRTLRKLNVPES